MVYPRDATELRTRLAAKQLACMDVDALRVPTSRSPRFTILPDNTNPINSLSLLPTDHRLLSTTVAPSAFANATRSSFVRHGQLGGLMRAAMMWFRLRVEFSTSF